MLNYPEKSETFENEPAETLPNPRLIMLSRRVVLPPVFPDPDSDLEPELRALSAMPRAGKSCPGAWSGERDAFGCTRVGGGG